MVVEIVKTLTDKEQIKKELGTVEILVQDIQQLKVKNIDGKIYIELKVKKKF